MISFINTFAVCLMATDVSILAFTFGMTYCFRFFCNVLYEIIVKDFKSFYQGFGIRDFWLLVLKKKPFLVNNVMIPIISSFKNLNAYLFRTYLVIDHVLTFKRSFVTCIYLFWIALTMQDRQFCSGIYSTNSLFFIQV